MNPTFRLFLAGAICLCAILPGGFERWAAKAAGAQRFELMHLWIDPIEARALAVLRKAVEDAGLVWRDHRIDGNFYGVRTAFAERLAMQVPPDAVFWIGGQSLNNMIASGTFRRFKDIPGLAHFVEALHPAIRSTLVSAEGLSALPLVVHLQNYVVFNKAVYQNAALPLPRSWVEFIESAPTLRKHGIIPLSMSDQRWQLRFLFEAILAERMGPALFEDFLRATDPPKSAPAIHQALIESLQLLDRLRGLTNEDYSDLDWGRVVNLVKTGAAAAAVLGDFMTPLFDDETRFACGLSPGSTFIIWSNDVIAFPKFHDKARTDAQDRVMASLLNPKVRHDFVEGKGGLPVTEVEDNPKFNHCTQAGIQIWRSSIPKVHIEANDWSSKLNFLAAMVESFWIKHNKTVEETAELMMKAIFQPSPRGPPQNATGARRGE